MSNPLCFGVGREHTVERLDTYYQKPEFRSNRTRVEAVPHVMFDELITYIGNGETPRGAQYPGTGIPFLRVQNIVDDHLDLTDVVYITESRHRQMTRSQLEPRNLLMAISGATIGKCAIVPEGIGECNTNQHLACMVLRDDVNERYIHAYLVSGSGQLQVKRNISGGTQGYINYNRIRSFLIPYPASEVQAAVADKMDAAYRRKQELEAEAKALLGGIDGYVLDHVGRDWGADPQTVEESSGPAFFTAWRHDVGRLDPKRYRWQSEIEDTEGLRHLGELLISRRDKVDRGEYGFEDLQLITLHFDGTIEPRNIPSWRTDIKGALYFAHPGDLVYSKIDARNGAIGLVPDELGRVAVTSEYPVYQIREGFILPAYLKLVLRSSRFTALLKALASGHSGRRRIYPDTVEDIHIPVPAIEEQRKIADEVQRRRERAAGLQGEADQVVAKAKAEVERMILGEE